MKVSKPNFETIKAAVISGSPFGKVQTPHTAHKAYVTSITLSLLALGFKQSETESILLNIQVMGIPLNVTRQVIEQIYSKNPKAPALDEPT